MQDKNRANQILMCILFSAILLLFFFSNIKTFCNAFMEQLNKESETELQERMLLTEKSLQNGVYKKGEFVNLYGAALNCLNWKIVGNYEFVKDDHNIVQLFVNEMDPAVFIKSLQELNELTQKNGTPLVYVTLPDKTEYFDLGKSDHFHFNGQMSTVVSQLLPGNIDCLNIRECMASKTDAPSFDELFFKTDVHCSTYGEFWIAKEVAKHLADKYHVTFPNAKAIFDLVNYEITNYEFVGNTARSAGEYFAGTDQFQIYKPKFSTNITLMNPSVSERKTGKFENTMLNGYENSKHNKYTYWVTNYGRFTSPYYNYINENASEDAPELLVVCDSIFMRGFSYLTLASKKVTVLDPRYFRGKDYLRQLLGLNHYDAVIVIGTKFYYTTLLMPEAANLPTIRMKTEEEYGEWIGNKGVCIDAYNDTYVQNSPIITLDPSAMNVELSGWAADFSRACP